MLHILVMGIAGAGKTTLARALAQALACPFIDGDDFHSEAARMKMAAGLPLDDRDRAPWLERIKSHIEGQSQRLVLACSTLKESYRDTLGLPIVVFMSIDAITARQRLQARQGHFVDDRLLESQMCALEIPTTTEHRHLIIVGAQLTTTEQTSAILQQLSQLNALDRDLPKSPDC